MVAYGGNMEGRMPIRTNYVSRVELEAANILQDWTSVGVWCYLN